MTGSTEDFLGKALISTIFASFTVFQAASVFAVASNPEAGVLWTLALTSKVFTLIFVLLVVYLTVTRLPPLGGAQGIEPRVSAVAGTFILLLLIALPAPEPGFWRLVSSTALIVLGTLLSIYCLYRLGRSFSIMATARRLVCDGPYALVRHPLYFAEAVTTIGVLVSSWSLAALLLGVVQFSFQVRRMRNEEAVLRRTFPEYDDYARRVPMFVPGLRMG